MEIAREFQLMEFIESHAEFLPDRQCEGSRAATMPTLPGQEPIDFLAGLTDEDAFNVAARQCGEPQVIDFPK
jgi:hypothetical protein